MAIRSRLTLSPPAWRTWLLTHYWSAPTPPTPAAVAAALRGTACADRLASLPLYTLWTSDGVAALAAWIHGQGLRRVVEVGAGDGCLTRWLQPLLPTVQLIATDSGAWRTVVPRAPVIRATATAAPRLHAADGVVASWMPYGTDWTPAWRATPSVRAYVLIGEGPGGCVGADTSWSPPPGWSTDPVPGFRESTWCRTDGHRPTHNQAWGVTKEASA